MAAIPFLWVLWSDWGGVNPLRTLSFESNYYDIQARAMLHGRLSIPPGSIGVEAFVVHGTSYTYFGLFPSILRLPFVAWAPSLFGRLTAPSMLLAWLVTAAFTGALLWRVRLLVRGSVPLGWTEATSFGALTAALLSGSIFPLLAATPYTFNEDLAWSIALTVGCLYALLLVLDRPSWRRLALLVALLVPANLDRLTTGWMMSLAVGLVALWFLLGRGPEGARRWWIPLGVVALASVAVGALVNQAKFGTFFGLPITDQVYSHVNVARQRFLAAHHGSEVGLPFVWSNVFAYFRPEGIRLTSVFPFVTLPASPAASLGGVLFDRRYRTASLPASMPLLFLLSCWGLVTAFRPRSVGHVAVTRILLVCAGGAGAALFIWGYIAPRYLADFVPFLVLASAIGLADLWRRLDGAGRRRRGVLMGLMVVLSVASMAIGTAVAVTPTEQWTNNQVLAYVRAQKSLQWIGGGSLQARVVRSASLPERAPADQLRMVGNCDALYISNGEDYSSDPEAQAQRRSWQVVEYGPALRHTFLITPRRTLGPVEVPLVRAGSWTVSVRSVPRPGGLQALMTYAVTGSGRQAGTVHASFPALEPIGGTHQIVVVTDPNTELVSVTVDGMVVVQSTDLVDGRPVEKAVPEGQDQATTGITVVSTPNQDDSLVESLCRSPRG